MQQKIPGGWGLHSLPKITAAALRGGFGRRALQLGCFVGLVLLCAGAAFAQEEGWPTLNEEQTKALLPGKHGITRGTGFYFNPFMIGILWLIFILWVKCVDWVSNDCQTYKIPYAKWVPIAAGPFLIGFFLIALVLPWFWLGAPIALLSVLVPTIIYVFVRNEEVEPHEQVLTKSHLRFVLSEMVNKMGGKMSAEAKAAHEKGAAVDFMPFGGAKNQDSQANMIRARQSPGYLQCKQIVADAAEARAEKIMLDFNAASMSARHQIDGVWHDTDGLEREEGDEMLSTMKLIANMTPGERKARQQGQVGVKFAGKKYFCSITSQGTKTGERTIISLGNKANVFPKLDDVGMREPVIKLLKEKMLQQGGILLFSAMPAGGLTTTFCAAVNSTDRLLRDFVSLEPHNDRMPEIENVDPLVFEEGDSIFEKLPGVLRKDADVLIVPKLTDKQSVEALCKAAKDRLIFMQIPAKDAVEAMLRVLMIKVPIKDFASVISIVVNQRLIRKLCEDCKEGYKPSAAQLQKLRLPAGRIDQFYKPHVMTPEDKEICPTCNGIGYFGRTAIFEVVEVKENLRKTLLTQPKLDVLRKASRADENRTIQEEGILAVVQGVTSLAEVQRVLKQ